MSRHNIRKGAITMSETPQAQNGELKRKLGLSAVIA